MYNSQMANNNFENDRMNLNLNFRGPNLNGYSSAIANNNIGNNEMYVSSNANLY